MIFKPGDVVTFAYDIFLRAASANSCGKDVRGQVKAAIGESALVLSMAPYTVPTMWDYCVLTRSGAVGWVHSLCFCEKRPNE